MPTKRSQMGAETMRDRIYVFGGMANFHLNVNVTEAYIPEFDMWEQGLPPLPRNISHMASATHMGRIYSIGALVPGIVDGFYGMPLTFALDPREGYWVKLSDMPTGRGALIAEQIDGTIYAIGGKNSNYVLTNNEAYQIRMDRWELRAPLPQATNSMSSGIANGQIHVLGGRLFSLISNMDLNQRYDPRRDTWSMDKTLPYSVSGNAGLTFNGDIYTFGGENGYQTLNVASRYNPTYNVWRNISSLPIPLHGHAVSAYRNNIYIFGGGQEPGFSINNYTTKFTPK